MHLDQKQIDTSITWANFQKAANGKSSMELANSQKIEMEFMGKMVEWSGTVLRVDSFDEDMEYIKKEQHFKNGTDMLSFELIDTHEDDQ